MAFSQLIETRPAPEKTAILLQPVVPVPTDFILVPVRSTPLFPFVVPIRLYTWPLFNGIEKVCPAGCVSVLADGVISTTVLSSVATTNAQEFEAVVFAFWVKFKE